MIYDNFKDYYQNVVDLFFFGFFFSFLFPRLLLWIYNYQVQSHDYKLNTRTDYNKTRSRIQVKPKINNHVDYVHYLQKNRISGVQYLLRAVITTRVGKLLKIDLVWNCNQLLRYWTDIITDRFFSFFSVCDYFFRMLSLSSLLMLITDYK